MKKLILSVTAVAGFSVGALAQGTITFDTSASTTGFVYINGVLDTSSDINAELLYSTTGTPGTFSPVVTLLLSSGASTSGLGQVGYAAGDITDDSNGTLYSDQGASFVLPIAAAATGYFEIEGWTGANVSSYAAATTKGTTSVFAETLTTANAPTQASLDQAPALNLTAVPEPSTLAMAGVGLASMLIFRRKNK
jgi:hypothetical protein